MNSHFSPQIDVYCKAKRAVCAGPASLPLAGKAEKHKLMFTDIKQAHWNHPLVQTFGEIGIQLTCFSTFAGRPLPMSTWRANIRSPHCKGLLSAINGPFIKNGSLYPLISDCLRYPAILSLFVTRYFSCRKSDGQILLFQEHWNIVPCNELVPFQTHREIFNLVVRKFVL